MFVVLDAVQAVYLGGVLQRIDGFLLSGLVFGLSSAACILWTIYKSNGQFQKVLKNGKTLIGLNVTAAGGWLFYLFAVQLIEPAVAFMIFAGSIPLITIAAAWAGISEAQAPRNTLEWVGNSILAGGLVTISIVTIAGLSGFVRSGTADAVTGILLAFAAGIFITVMLLYGQRLDQQGVNPVTQFGFRFPLFLALSWSAVGLQLGYKGPVPFSDLAGAVAIGLLVLAFPIYAVQKAISLTSALTIGALAATSPSIVFVSQVVEGRVDASLYTLTGLMVCFVGALVAAGGASLVGQPKP